MSESVGGKDGRVCDRCVGRHLPSSVVPRGCRQKVKVQNLTIFPQRELSGTERETRRVAGTETPLGAPGCCPAIPIAGVPFSGFVLWDLLPKSKSSSQSSSCGEPPAWAE